jgi:hypothetical protein
VPILELKNVRCFADPGPARIAPLTILVGENSTGKSSFLALYRIALEVANGRLDPSFNRDPFFLGAYDQIAFDQGELSGPASSIEISLHDSTLEGVKAALATDGVISLVVSFTKSDSLAAISKLSFNSDKSSFTIDTNENFDDNYTISVLHTPENEYPLIVATRIFKELASGNAIYLNTLSKLILSDVKLYHVIRNLAASKNSLKISASKEEIDEAFKQTEIPISAQELAKSLERFIGAVGYKPYAIAPVRTKPARTYDPVDDVPTAEGAHIPMLLAKMQRADLERWEQMRPELEAFGRNSGLFDEIFVRSLGASDSDPFQVMVNLSGRRSNLIDVGYGVSQVLPIIVDLLEGNTKRAYLLQQPEVHLHPRAQAALGSFFCDVVKTTDNQILVETHSDYIIDRVRMQVMEKTLPPEDVSILYFEREGRSVRIHQLSLDENGNLLGAPPSYRDFFLAEEYRLFGL